MPKSRGRKQKKTGRQVAVVHSGHHGERDELAALQRMLAAAGAPPALLDALAGDPESLAEFRDMIESGPTSSDDALSGLLDHWAETLQPGVHPLDAELFGADFLAMLRAGAQDDSDVPDMLADMIKQAETTGRPEALALLRVLAVVGPEPVRYSAAGAADRLVAAGQSEPSWAPHLGAPTPGSAFGYTDLFGIQESLVLTYSYGRKRHGVCVLIDHGLGGGVKDVFFTDRVEVLRKQFQRTANEMGAELRDYRPTDARAVLERALGNDPCPVALDQIQDVNAYLDLLRSRVALNAPAPPAEQGKPANATRTVHRVKISLRGSKPPIWRRLEVPSDITLARLHDAIQAAFGWMNCHLWVFETPLGEYGTTDPELGHRSAAAMKLSAIAPRAGDRIRYTYDFGDDWNHDILVEDVRGAAPDVAYPRCLAGRRAGPPEDCGGIWGYQELRDTLADPDHPEHQDMLAWLGLSSAKDFEPAEFDLGSTNEALSRLANVVRN